MIKLKNKMFGRNDSKIVSSGLYYHISANDPLSYDGTNIIKDLSGNGNNGTIHSSPIKTGSVLQFDGVDDYIDMGNILNVGTGEITYTIWLKNNTNSTKSIIGKTIYGGFPGRYGLGNDNGVYFYFEANNIDLSYLYPSINGVMASITHIIKRDKQEVYVNGVLATTLNSNIGSNNYQPNIKFLISAYGNAQGNGVQAGFFNNMQFGESFGYNRALTATEVLQNYNALKNKYL